MKVKKTVFIKIQLIIVLSIIIVATTISVASLTIFRDVFISLTEKNIQNISRTLANEYAEKGMNHRVGRKRFSGLNFLAFRRQERHGGKKRIQL